MTTAFSYRRSDSSHQKDADQTVRSPAARDPVTTACVGRREKKRRVKCTKGQLTFALRLRPGNG